MFSTWCIFADLGRLAQSKAVAFRSTAIYNHEKSGVDDINEHQGTTLTAGGPSAPYHPTQLAILNLP